MAGETKPPRDEDCIYPAIRGKCSPREADRLIVKLAEAQHGMVARRQLVEAGVTERAIDERLGRRLHAVHRGVYAVGFRVPGLEARWMGAVLASGPTAVLSHRSAAQLWGLTWRTSGLPEVTRPRTFRAQARIRAHRSTVPDDERGVRDGIPVTSVPRTVLDLAGLGDRRDIERALHEVEARRLYDKLSIADLLDRYPGRRGSVLLREVLGVDTGATINDFEDDFAALLERHDLPRPRFNADLAVGGRSFRPDCLWSDERLIVELDGREVHGTDKAFEDDRERDRLLLLDGWRVIRVTWRQLRGQEAAIAADVRRALSQGSTLNA